MNIPLAVIEDIIDSSGAAARIEARLPAGARRRQLTTRTLLAGMMLTLADNRPAHLTRVHAALTSLPPQAQTRLGVLADWENGPHQLTYRQVEHTFRLVATALGKHQPDGTPAPGLQTACDQLLQASIPAHAQHVSTALAADWTDVETWSRPPRHGTTTCADPEAAWGHRSPRERRTERWSVRAYRADSPSLDQPRESIKSHCAGQSAACLCVADGSEDFRFCRVESGVGGVAEA